MFSPDERLVLTGTSADRGGRGGALVFFDAKTHALVRRVAVPGSAVALNWHERLNQIFVGVGARAPRFAVGYCQRHTCARASGVEDGRCGEALSTVRQAAEARRAGQPCGVRPVMSGIDKASAQPARPCAHVGMQGAPANTPRARAGDKASGCVRALYSPTFSERGVLLCAGRKLRAKDPFDFQARSMGASHAVARRCTALRGAAVWCAQSALQCPPAQADATCRGATGRRTAERSRCVAALRLHHRRTRGHTRMQRHASQPVSAARMRRRNQLHPVCLTGAQAPLVIHTPHALPLFREPRPGGKRKREKERADPVKSQMPDRGGAAPLKPGTGGQIGATGGTLLTQYVLKNQARDHLKVIGHHLIYQRLRRS